MTSHFATLWGRVMSRVLNTGREGSMASWDAGRIWKHPRRHAGKSRDKTDFIALCCVTVVHFVKVMSDFRRYWSSFTVTEDVSHFVLPLLAKEHHGREERAAEEPETPVSGPAPLLLSDRRKTLLCAWLCKRRRGTCLTAKYNKTELRWTQVETDLERS